MLTPTMRLAGLASLGLHACVLGGLWLWSQRTPLPVHAPDTEGAVELVMLEQKGTAAPTAPPASASPEAPPAPPALPEPQQQAELPLPRPPAAPPSKPMPPSPPVADAPEAPKINLGGNDSDTNAIVLDGPHVIPASVDAKSHNREPVYPPDAARRAEQGTVMLSIHVSPQGLPMSVDIARSSGFVSLDRAASDAVWQWHFLPAMQNGQPIPFDMQLRVVFQLD